jgi:ATP-binding cassette, subfamily B, bacterial
VALEKKVSAEFTPKGNTAFSAATTTRVPYRKLLHWGWYVVRGARVPFFIMLGLGVINQALQKYLVLLVMTIVGTFSTSQQTVTSGQSIGGFLAPLVPHDPKTAVFRAAGLTLLSISLVFSERILTTWSNARMLARLQQELHDRLLMLGPSYHRKHDVGETTAIVSRFAMGAQMMLGDFIAFPVARGIELVTALVFLTNGMSQIGETPVAMRGALLAALFVLPVVSIRLATSLRKAFTKVRQSDLALSDELANSLTQPLEVQLMGAQNQRANAYRTRLEAFVRDQVKASVRSEVASQVSSGIPKVLQAVFLICAVLAAANHSNSAAAAAIFGIYYFVPDAIRPIQQILQYTSGLSASWPTVETVIEVLEREPDIRESLDAVALREESREVRFHDVTFSYGGRGKPVLDKLNVVFPAGSTTALVGASGSGKSTIFNLIARLSDPEEGSILFGDQDLRSVRLNDLRQRVARVAQFPMFIVDTVRENFLLSKPDATDDEIRQVCEGIGLWEVLVRIKPDAPLDYVLPRELSQGLSGGQRRLLAIARAMLHRPAVLLLDEPSPGLDNITLQLLIRFLKTSRTGVTVLLIDHDIEGFVANTADQICVLEQGRITDSGSHKELSEKPGLYQQLIHAARGSASQGTA